MFIFKTPLFLLVIFAIFKATISVDYCKANLCKGKPHIACKNNGKFVKSCASNAKLVTITTKIQNQIVNKHNTLRNKFAKGLAKYQPAARMATMRWNSELAKMAALNVRQCVMKHDKCRNTPTFKFSGQNLAATASSGKIASTSTIDKHIDAWFNEYKLASMAIMKKYKPLGNGKDIGHFTAMVQEKSTHVGCAIMQQKKGKNSEQLMACNYAFTNVQDKPVYTVGKAASKCKKGKNPKYNALCSVNEVYDISSAN